MNKKIFDYIKFLSSEDKKDLTGKALKTSNEAGDLAKVVLAYTNQPGAIHQFVERESVLNEAVDTILCAISCAYDVGFTTDEIESMIVKKSAKWRSLQVKEDAIKNHDNIPYEIHITVENVECEHFKKVCNEIGVKPIILDLQSRAGNVLLEDVQTSSVLFGNNQKAYAEVERVNRALTEAGISVVRSKIETVPWHPAAPSSQFGPETMPKDCYFESHLAVVVEEPMTLEESLQWERLCRSGAAFIPYGVPPSIELLKDLATRYDAHLSRNMFKRIDKKRYIIMMTLRSYDAYKEDFENVVEFLKMDIQELGFEVDKTIIEFSIYDTKITHDKAWINEVSNKVST